MLQVRIGHHPAAQLPALSQPIRLFLVEHELDARGAGHRLPGEIILCRTEAAGDDHGVGPRARRRDRCDDAGVVVTNHRLLVVLEPCVGEAFSDLRCVGVHDLAKQKFGADGEDFDDHARPCTTASRSVP